MRNNDLIQSKLEYDEYIIWEDKPNYRRFFDFSDIFMIPISLFVLSLALVQFIPGLAINLGFASFSNSKEGWDAMSYFAIPFVIFGLYFTIGRLLVRVSTLKNTEYYLTSKRIIVYKDVGYGGVSDSICSSRGRRTRVFTFGGELMGTQVRNIGEIGKKTAVRNIYGGLDVKFIETYFPSGGLSVISLKNIKDAELVLDVINELKEGLKYSSFK